MWTRRQVLAQIGLAAAAVHTLDPHELCCVMPAHAQTADKDLFELKKVGDGVYAAIAAPRYKVNCNAAVIMTNDGVVVVDSHSKPSAARSLYNEISPDDSAVRADQIRPCRTATAHHRIRTEHARQRQRPQTTHSCCTTDTGTHPMPPRMRR
jgi:hypothetical protein